MNMKHNEKMWRIWERMELFKLGNENKEALNTRYWGMDEI